MESVTGGSGFGGFCGVPLHDPGNRKLVDIPGLTLQTSNLAGTARSKYVESSSLEVSGERSGAKSETSRKKAMKGNEGGSRHFQCET